MKKTIEILAMLNEEGCNPFAAGTPEQLATLNLKICNLNICEYLVLVENSDQFLLIYKSNGSVLASGSFSDSKYNNKLAWL